jgi:ribosome biogenesis GTPase
MAAAWTEGRIIKGIAGFYYVQHEDKVIECKARGKFKKMGLVPMVGDRILFSEVDSTIEEILPRTSELFRPTVANVDQAVIVFAVMHPDPNIVLLDKMTVMAVNEGLEVVLVLNKVDLDTQEASLSQELEKMYVDTGFKVISTCSVNGYQIDLLREALKDRLSVFAGPSGVGKSSLLNAIEPGLALKTGVVSEKIQRGKHTTRHSELIALKSGGFVVDTPGFTSLELRDLKPEELSSCFPDFDSVEGDCRFDNCLHAEEPDCRIIRAVAEGRLSKSRYTSYLYILNELRQLRRY